MNDRLSNCATAVRGFARSGYCAYLRFASANPCRKPSSHVPLSISRTVGKSRSITLIGIGQLSSTYFSIRSFDSIKANGATLSSRSLLRIASSFMIVKPVQREVRTAHRLRPERESISDCSLSSGDVPHGVRRSRQSDLSDPRRGPDNPSAEKYGARPVLLARSIPRAGIYSPLASSLQFLRSPTREIGKSPGSLSRLSRVPLFSSLDCSPDRLLLFKSIRYINPCELRSNQAIREHQGISGRIRAQKWSARIRRDSYGFERVRTGMKNIFMLKH